MLSVDEPPIEVKEENFQRKTLIGYFKEKLSFGVVKGVSFTVVFSRLLCPIDDEDDVSDPLFGQSLEENTLR
uniref:Uncharacterized protein n=1 Tax=Angiostrongylus cantonensis TaxID=6313 RepID=A0A0K0CVU5_ANGCA